MLYKTTLINLNKTFSKKDIKKQNEINEIKRWNKNLFVERALLFIINNLGLKLKKRKINNKIKLFNKLQLNVDEMLIFYKLIERNISFLSQITKNKKLVSLFDINKLLKDNCYLHIFEYNKIKNVLYSENSIDIKEQLT